MISLHLNKELRFLFTKKLAILPYFGTEGILREKVKFLLFYEGSSKFHKKFVLTQNYKNQNRGDKWEPTLSQTSKITMFWKTDKLHLSFLYHIIFVF